MRFAVTVTFLAFALSQFGLPQTSGRTPTSRKPSQITSSKRQLSPREKFLSDVVRWSVALPVNDPQDRLRVLKTAAEVIGPVNRASARRYAREGARIEAQLISGGQVPDVSVFSTGYFDCAGADAFVGMVPTADVTVAEQSLINVTSSCPKQGTQAVRQKLETALDQGVVAPRALLALMEQLGPSSSWSQEAFGKAFRTLPSDVEKHRSEVPNFAAMYSQMAPHMEKATVRDSGLRLLEWLGKLDESGERNLAVNVTTDALKKALGEKGYEDALAGNVTARSAAQTAGKPGEAPREEEESASVLGAMRNNGSDQSSELSKMPASKRAREAAAHGFATGTAGDKHSAERYFDIAFSAADEVWNNRGETKNAPAVIQEVSEAAAHVDAPAALARAQRLGDPSAQAIGMLAVARVVLGQGLEAAGK